MYLGGFRSTFLINVRNLSQKNKIGGFCPFCNDIYKLIFHAIYLHEFCTGLVIQGQTLARVLFLV